MLSAQVAALATTSALNPVDASQHPLPDPHVDQPVLLVTDLPHRAGVLEAGGLVQAPARVVGECDERQRGVEARSGEPGEEGAVEGGADPASADVAVQVHR